MDNGIISEMSGVNTDAGNPGHKGPAGQPAALRRTITGFLLTLFIVGDMIGGGIYALVGEVGAITGGAIWTAFLLALILAAFTAFAYAELVTKYPKAGGAAFYIHRAFRNRFFSFIVAFAVVMSGVTSASTLSLAFAGDYMEPFVQVPTVPVAIGFIIVVAFINYRGIAESVTLNAIFTTIELSGLLLIVVIGVVALVQGTAEPARAMEFKDGVNIPMAIIAGAALSFYAFMGFEDSVNVAEETRNPSKNFPRALLGGIALAGIIYLGVTITASMVVPTDVLAASTGPLLEVVKYGPLNLPLTLFSIIALIALSNGALINMIMASRLLYGMSGEDVMPTVLGKLHPRRRTPWVAIILTTLIAIGLISTGDLGDLAKTTVLLLLLVFIVVNIAVLVLRRDPVEHKHFRTPLVFPILGILICLGLLTQQSGEVWLRGIILIAIGAALYLINILAHYGSVKR